MAIKSYSVSWLSANDLLLFTSDDTKNAKFLDAQFLSKKQLQQQL